LGCGRRVEGFLLHDRPGKAKHRAKSRRGRGKYGSRELCGRRRRSAGVVKRGIMGE